MHRDKPVRIRDNHEKVPRLTAAKAASGTHLGVPNSSRKLSDGQKELTVRRKDKNLTKNWQPKSFFVNCFLISGNYVTSIIFKLKVLSSCLEPATPLVGRTSRLAAIQCPKTFRFLKNNVQHCMLFEN